MTSGQMWFFWKSGSHYQVMNIAQNDKTSQALLRAMKMYFQSQKDSSLWRPRAFYFLGWIESMNFSQIVAQGLL